MVTTMTLRLLLITVCLLAVTPLSVAATAADHHDAACPMCDEAPADAAAGPHCGGGCDFCHAWLVGVPPFASGEAPVTEFAFSLPHYRDAVAAPPLQPPRT